MIKNEELRQAIDDIMDCIAAGDSGVKLVRFLNQLNEVQSQSDDGSEAAMALLDIVYQFQLLINSLTK